MPVIPILLNSRFGVISIQKQKVDWIDPTRYCLEAKFIYPNYAPIVNIVYCVVCHAFHGVESLHATEVERVNQPKASLWRHYLADCGSGGALRDSDLNQARFSTCPFPQGIIFCLRMLSQDGSQAQ